MDHENQELIEHMFNSRQTIPMIQKELLDCVPIVELINKSGLPTTFCLDLLTQMVLHKRAALPVLVGLLVKHNVDRPNPYQHTAEMLQLAAEKDLVDYDTDARKFILKYDLDTKSRDLINQYQYMPPMIVPPRKVKSDYRNRGSGYLTIRNDSLYLKDNHHEGDICADSLNKFNQIALSLNERVVKGIRNSWKSLDKPKADETYEDYTKRVKAFEKYEKDSYFTLALMKQMGNQFWLTHKKDKRGRTYAQGYHITTQGNCWNKAVLEFHKKELVT